MDGYANSLALALGYIVLGIGCFTALFLVFEYLVKWLTERVTKLPGIWRRTECPHCHLPVNGAKESTTTHGCPTSGLSSSSSLPPSSGSLRTTKNEGK
jgi:hypothetical protein